VSGEVGSSTASAAPYWARMIAAIVLGLPRVSPLRPLGWLRRRRMIAAGALPVTARAFDGSRIDALFFRATHQAADPRLPVVINHGYVEVKEMHQREVNLLRAHGHDVLLYDLRAHGRSGGRFTTLGAWEPRDLASLIDAAVAQQIIGPRVITMGYSTGASTVLQHAARDTRVAGVIALAPFADLTSAVRSFHAKFGPRIPVDRLMQGFVRSTQSRGFTMTESNALTAIAHIDVPVLLVSGDRDVHLPPNDHFSPLAAAARHRDNVQQLVIPDADHLSIYMRRWPQLDEAIARFCDALM